MGPARTGCSTFGVMCMLCVEVIYGGTRAKMILVKENLMTSDFNLQISLL